MEYYLAAKVADTFDNTIERITNALSQEGFGILSDIDVRQTMKQKLGADFRRYRILGACNPPFAHKALTAEDKIGTLLPCSVVVQELEPGTVEVAAVDPVASMQVVDNSALMEVATEVRDRLARAVESLK